MEHVGIVVDDLAAATEFFVELGLELQGKGSVEGRWVDRIVGLGGVRTRFAMMQTPDGNGRLELVKFQSPASWSAMRISTGSATSAARTGSSSSLQSGSADGSGPPPTPTKQRDPTRVPQADPWGLALDDGRVFRVSPPSLSHPGGLRLSAIAAASAWAPP
jgi:catechol 2,3-dioxygenase-like lactoylglutathione lyase family enzyme